VGAGGILFWGDAKPVGEGAREAFVRVEDEIQGNVEHSVFPRAQGAGGCSEPLPPDVLEGCQSGFGFEDPGCVKLRVACGFRHIVGGDRLVKMDGDGQMDPAYLPDLLRPIIEGRADYTKGNRFADNQMLYSMPFIRRMGNLGLSFLLKLASGYWKIFDPTNGYTALMRWSSKK